MQNPKSKLLRFGLRHKDGGLKQSKIRNSKSKLQTSTFGFGMLGVNTYPQEKCKTLNILGKKKVLQLPKSSILTGFSIISHAF